MTPALRAIRWALVPVAAMAGCLGTVVAAGAASDGIRHFIAPNVGMRMETIVPVDARTGLVYALAAAVWVLAGTRTAPARRIATAVLLYLAGAWLAWSQLYDWYIPEGYPRAYQVSHLPLFITLGGGLLATAAIVMTHRTHRKETS